MGTHDDEAESIRSKCSRQNETVEEIIKFRLGGRAHSLTLLELARRLGLYQAIEIDEEGFNVYFKGGLRNDEHFNAQEYWLSISREESFGLPRSHTSTIRNLILKPGVPRVGIPRPSSASMQDLYDRMGRIEIRQEYPPAPSQYQQQQDDDE
nr:hypothetical protein [Tanacetum cinerariifolium]